MSLQRHYNKGERLPLFYKAPEMAWRLGITKKELLAAAERGDVTSYQVGARTLLFNIFETSAWFQAGMPTRETQQREKDEAVAAEAAAAMAAGRDYDRLPGYGREFVGVWVYFIQSGASGPIKIGSALWPTQRLSELQTGNPETLSILACIYALPAVEFAMHRLFKKERLRGEWFEPSERLMRFIEGLE